MGLFSFGETVLTTPTTTTTPLLTKENLTPELRSSVVDWSPDINLLHLQDGNLFLSACEMCDAEKIREYTQSSTEAQKTGTPYWGFDVNRQFGQVDRRKCACVNYIAFSWNRWDEYQRDDPLSAAEEIADGTARNFERCGKALDVLKTRPNFDLDHGCDAQDNALYAAMVGDNFAMAKKLVSMGEQKTARTITFLNTEADTCSNECSMALAVPQMTIDDITRFESEKQSPRNKDDYLFANQTIINLHNAYKWCHFFTENNLRCPPHDRNENMLQLFTKPGVTKQQQWAGAYTRRLFKIAAAPGDAEIFKEVEEKTFQPWRIEEHLTLAGKASQSVWDTEREEMAKEAEAKAEADAKAKAKAALEKEAKQERKPDISV